MRLTRPQTGQKLKYRLLLGMMGASALDRPPDVVRVMLYRPEFFGANYLRLTDLVMTGPSDWSRGERELFAAVTSGINECEF